MREVSNVSNLSSSSRFAVEAVPPAPKIVPLVTQESLSDDTQSLQEERHPRVQFKTPLDLSLLSPEEVVSSAVPF
jgi:hypothetical protein